MKNQLITTVKEMKAKGVDFVKDHPLFKWSYPEMPEMEFQLLILEIKPLDKGEETPKIVLH